jgi:hypothetical protein
VLAGVTLFGVILIGLERERISIINIGSKLLFVAVST